MNKKHINDLFERLSPTTEQKERLYSEIVQRAGSPVKRDKRRLGVIFKTAFAGALCAAVILVILTFYPHTPVFAVHAMGGETSITSEYVEISTGKISDSGEMYGHLLQLYVTGEKIDGITFTCGNQYLEFNDWTERQPFAGKVKSVDVMYKDVIPSEYSFLRIDWIPWDTQKLLSENQPMRISDLPLDMREDFITLEVKFEGGKTAKSVIQVMLNDGVVLARLIDRETVAIPN